MPMLIDGADALAGGALPRAVAHLIGEVAHPPEHLVDVGDDVVAVDLDDLVAPALAARRAAPARFSLTLIALAREHRIATSRDTGRRRPRPGGRRSTASSMRCLLIVDAQVADLDQVAASPARGRRRRARAGAVAGGRRGGRPRPLWSRCLPSWPHVRRPRTGPCRPAGVQRRSHVHVHLLQLDGAELGDERDVGGVAAVGDGDPVAAGCGLGGVEREPATADVGLEPGVLVHRVEPVQVADDHARRDVEAAAQRDAEVGEVAAHAGAAVDRVDGRRLTPSWCRTRSARRARSTPGSPRPADSRGARRR